MLLPYLNARKKCQHNVQKPRLQTFNQGTDFLVKAGVGGGGGGKI